MSLRNHLVDTTPLRISRDFRWLYIGRTGLLVGAMLTETALIWQIYQLSGSNLAVGAAAASGGVGIVIGLLVGGVLADKFDRRRILVTVRVPGLLVSVDESAGSYVAELRPLGDDRRGTENGRVTVLTDADTRFEVDGDVLGRTEALAALTALGADGWTSAVGSFDAVEGTFTAVEVLAGESVPRQTSFWVALPARLL